MLLEPPQTDHDHKDVDHPQVCKYRKYIDHELLINLECLDVDSGPGLSILVQCREGSS